MITVAMDTGGVDAAARIEAAKPAHPSLIDQCHTVSTLYNMVNVPSAVWINEEGRIVRLTEPAGTSEAGASWIAPPSPSPETLSSIGARRRAYTDAIRDWVQKGDASVHALSPDEVAERTKSISSDESLANANFRMGVYLHGSASPTTY